MKRQIFPTASKYPTGSYRPRFNGNSLACCAAPYDSSTQIPSLGEGDYASIVFDNELSNIPQGNITYRWFKCAGLGSGAGLVAIEFRVSHPKAIEDVRKYATVDFPVMEISITDDIANAGDTRKSLAERITGTGHATRFAGRKWLYSPAAKKILKRSWHIEAEPSDKPLRHKGTDLVRLETPLPAITVYAVKGAPTGETSWDNIDLTLREISEATVEKQEEALRKKRSLSSRCPSYKNSAPAGRQIKQNEDTGFETPTKPHGILGRLKGLFDKFRK